MLINNVYAPFLFYKHSATIKTFYKKREKVFLQLPLSVNILKIKIKSISLQKHSNCVCPQFVRLVYLSMFRIIL